MDELRQVTLSKVICDNTENKRIQENVFLPASARNRKVDCSQIPGINLDKWEGDGRGGGGQEGRRPRTDFSGDKQ
ncbi:peroxidasin-like protein [Elysia marginata]|uniref:Peroxidasin-like protein n=1 Tax=Elysia marginata TaxID=1093978 RepID=A0AAV4F1X3_9GAST|nr:peroxidasin-like protein [Elysia marginata]